MYFLLIIFWLFAPPTSFSSSIWTSADFPFFSYFHFIRWASLSVPRLLFANAIPLRLQLSRRSLLSIDSWIRTVLMLAKCKANPGRRKPCLRFFVWSFFVNYWSYGKAIIWCSRIWACLWSLISVEGLPRDRCQLDRHLPINCPSRCFMRWSCWCCQAAFGTPWH